MDLRSRDSLLPQGKYSKSRTGWQLYTDGASKGNPGPAGAGWVLENDQDSILVKESSFLGEATNNEAEYQALILGVKKALACEVEEIRIFMDSELVVRQLSGLYRVKNPRLSILFKQVKDLLSRFSSYVIIHIPRENNREADRMANEAIRNNTK